MWSSKSPVLNAHGETRDTIFFILNDFINDNLKLGIKYIGVIHGWSSYVLKEEIHSILKKNKNVVSYYVDIFNPGLTIIELKVR